MALHGIEAVKKVTEDVGRPLTDLEKYIVELEGYSEEDYDDTVGVSTSGVGQTGIFKDKSFPEVVAYFEELTKNYIPAYDSLNRDLQLDLVQAAYRGDLQQSPKTRRLINEGNFAAASEEFLDNDDYRKEGQSQGIIDRMSSVSNSLQRQAEAPVEVVAPQPQPQPQVKAGFSEGIKNALFNIAQGISPEVMREGIQVPEQEEQLPEQPAGYGDVLDTLTSPFDSGLVDAVQDVYSVKPGDNLYGLAKSYGMSLDELLSINPQIDNPNLINVGQKVNVGEGWFDSLR